jgi:transcriptional regulator with XRE-family HTH domain
MWTLPSSSAATNTTARVSYLHGPPHLVVVLHCPVHKRCNYGPVMVFCPSELSIGGVVKLDRDKLLRAREVLGYGVEKTAEEAGVSKNSVLRAEHEGDIRPVTARKIAGALGVRVADLLEEERSKARALSPRDAEPETALTDDVVIFEAPYSSASFDEVMDEAREVIRGAKSLHVPEGMHHLALLIDNDKVEVRAKASASPASRTRRGRRATTKTRNNRETA